MTVPSLVLFGTAGHAITHLRRARALHSQGEITLAGACDIREPSPEARSLLPDGAILTADPARLLDRAGPDIAIIATPPHTHLDLARLVLAAGCHLFLEKPPVLDLTAFAELSGLLDRSGLACQVGFQSFGSAALPVLRQAFAAGEIGEITGVAAAGAWIRRDPYFERADWAGRRGLGGRPVVDGSLTNPFAHAVATALLLNGTAADLPGHVAVELYHARDIEADDTACARLNFTGAPDVVAAATLCAERDHEPYVLIHGTQGEARWEYKTDRLVINGMTVPVAPPTDLLGDLLAHLRDGTPLLAPLAATRAFTALVEAVWNAPDPRPVPEARARGRGPDRHVVIPGIDRHVDTAADRLALFSELGLPWADAAVGNPGRRTKGAS
jgi:predicted dehydrogenase